MNILQRRGGVLFHVLGPVLGLAIVCLVSCQTLPGTGTCGNGIVEVESREVCDGTTTLAGTKCNAQCQYSCLRDGDGSPEEGKCPGGFYCGEDRVCRAPSGEFVRDEVATMASDAYRVDVADVDDDGSLDLIATSPGFTRVHFFGGTKFNEISLIPNAGLTSPIVTSLTSDARTDLVFPSGQLTVWQGRGDRTLEPVQYPSIVFVGFGAQDARGVVVNTHTAFGRELATGDETYIFLSWSGAGAGSGSAVGLQRDFTLTPVQNLRAPADQIAGEVQVGDLDGDSCPDMVFGFLRRAIGTGTPGVDLFFPCKAIPGGVVPAPPLPSAEPAIRFPVPDGRPGRYVVGDKGVLLVDFDGDGKRDVLVHAEIDTDVPSDRVSFAKILLAYGVGDGRFQSSPLSDHGVTADGIATVLDSAALNFPKSERGAVVFPLAAQQLTNRGGNADTLADFVFPDRILLRTTSLQDGGASTIPAPKGIVWREARIDLINDDGYPDILAGSESGFDFYSGTIEPTVMTPFPFSVANGAKNFAVGDFDGDRAKDIAFSSSNELFVAFGTQNGPSAPTSMGRFPSIQHMVAGALDLPGQLLDGLADLAVIGKDTGESEAPFLAVLEGSISRKLVAPLELHQEGERQVFSSSKVAAVGIFDKTSPGFDIAAIGASVGAEPRETAFTLWNVPLTRDARVITNSVTQREFDVGSLGAAVGSINWDLAATGALDLDVPGAGDPLDELVVIAPPAKEVDSEERDVTRAGVLMLARLQDGVWTSQSFGAFGGGPESAQDKVRWKLRVTDVDDDKVKDLVALFYQAGGDHPGSHLQVYFNDRTGQLGAPLDIDVPGQQIVDCAWLRADKDSTDENKKDLVVLTVDAQHRYGFFLVRSDKTKRGFLSAESLAPDLGITAEAGHDFRASIAAGDVTADGVDDIVISAANQVLLFRGVAR